MKEKSIQKEDGYTSIANDLLDQLCKIRIPGEARQVLDVIFRQTYGWNKKEDMISLSQFSEKTGLAKPNVVRAIKQLLDMRLIIRSDNKDGSVYGPNKRCDQWIRVPKQTKRGRADGVVNRLQIDLIPTDVIRSDNSETVVTSDNAVEPDVIVSDNKPLSEAIIPVIRSDKKPLSEAIPTKDYMKDTVTKPKKPSIADAVGSPLHKAVTGYFFDEYKRRFGVSYPHAGGKDGMVVKRIVAWAGPAGITEQQIEACINAFFETDDEWVQTKGGFTLSVFWLQLPKIAPRIIGNMKGIHGGTDQQNYHPGATEINNRSGGIKSSTPNKYANLGKRGEKTSGLGGVGVAEGPEGKEPK
jgi:phage replication O-like protein O